MTDSDNGLQIMGNCELINWSGTVKKLNFAKEFCISNWLGSAWIDISNHGHVVHGSVSSTVLIISVNLRQKSKPIYSRDVEWSERARTENCSIMQLAIAQENREKNNRFLD
jgi:hypothetical protein